jgi:hypothetical protein
MCKHFASQYSKVPLSDNQCHRIQIFPKASISKLEQQNKQIRVSISFSRSNLQMSATSVHKRGIIHLTVEHTNGNDLDHKVWQIN